MKKKILLLVLSLLLSIVVISNKVSAVSLVYNKFGVYYSPRIQNNEITDCTNYLYREDLGWNTVFGACSLNRVLVESTSIAASGNDFTFSGKFNIVAQRSVNSSSPTISGFVNKNYFNLIGGTFAGSGFITKSTSLQTYITDWEKDGKPMQTFTVSFSITGSGVSGKTGSFRVLFGNTDYAFYYNELVTAEPPIYFEPDNQNLQASFSDNLTDGLLQEQINQNNVIINQNTENTQAIYENTRAVYENTQELYRQGDELEAQTQALNNMAEQQHSDYEDSVQREEDKQDELEDQADDVNISANAITNPFSNLFTSPNCATLPTLASWLNVSADKIQVCSPYPQQFRPIIEFVSSAIIVGLLIRVYYKQLKGGFAS